MLIDEHHAVNADHTDLYVLSVEAALDALAKSRAFAMRSVVRMSPL